MDHVVGLYGKTFWPQKYERWATNRNFWIYWFVGAWYKSRKIKNWSKMFELGLRNEQNEQTELD